ncbi:hypothetical protein [Amycolatopsis panacis]|uniref:hypothetical protein n=1 Tax=Amycolatopsis panacis TaxID=2340917 RepID=UPI0011C3586D|nr:hypothetical protein [Amycolatopsis panacis]
MNIADPASSTAELEIRELLGRRWREPADSFLFRRWKFLIFSPGRNTTIAWTWWKCIGYVILFPVMILIGIGRYLADEFGITKKLPERPGTVKLSCKVKNPRAMEVVDALKVAGRKMVVGVSRSHLAFLEEKSTSGNRRVIWESPPGSAIVVGPAAERRLDVDWPELAIFSIYLTDDQYGRVVRLLGPNRYGQ